MQKLQKNFLKDPFGNSFFSKKAAECRERKNKKCSWKIEISQKNSCKVSKITQIPFNSNKYMKIRTGKFFRPICQFVQFLEFGIRHENDHFDRIERETSRERPKSARYLKLNKTGTSTVGAMSTAQKAQSF